MMSSIPEDTSTKILNYLRSKNIKLWTSPYTDSDGNQTEDVSILANEISKEINKSSEIVAVCLHELRQHSIERLKQNENFQQNKIASLRIKSSSNRTHGKNEFQIVETKLDVDGKYFRNLVTENLRISDDIKLICCGRVIIDDKSLESQNIKHNSIILCLIISLSGRSHSSEVEKTLKAVSRARKGAELLGKLADESNSSTSNLDVQIADQKGQALDLPKEEKKSLTVALGLHEKGRAMLQRKEYELALLLLLEADKEFQECRAQILSMVDNYAVLCLDIVWCYVCTKNISALPDAKVRLHKCETAFEKSYGSSLQRLLTIKGSSGNEVSLFVRLYLLQGIILYHEGKYEEAMQLLQKSRGYASTVKIDELKVTEIMTLGLSASEARRALRATMMDVSRATQWAFQHREEQQEIKKQEKVKTKRKKLQKYLGHCADGNLVDMAAYDSMVIQMGFDPDLVAEALKHANNDVGGAIEMIDSRLELLVQAVNMNKAKETRSRESRSGTSRGFTEEEEELVRDVADDVTRQEDEYLDLTLDDETKLIEEYLSMIESVRATR